MFALTSLLVPMFLSACLGPDPAAITQAEPGGGPVQKPPAGGAPPEMGAGRPMGGGARMEPYGFQVDAGDGVMISGTLQYQGQAEGEYRIDFLSADEDGGVPGAAATVSLDAPGEWSIEAPKKFGKLQICAFLDINGDGPSPGEPKVMLGTPLVVGEDPIAGVALVILDNWDEVHMEKIPKGKPPGLQEANPEGSPTGLGDAPAEGAAPVEGPVPAEGAAPAGDAIE